MRTGEGMRTAFQKAVCISVASATALTGCVTPPPTEPIDVDPAHYSNLDCDQLNAEAKRVLARYAELGGELEESTKVRQAAAVPLVPLAVLTMTTPLVLLWLPFVPAMKEATKERQLREEEYRRLMGEREAILKVAAEKGCPGVTPSEQ